MNMRARVCCLSAVLFAYGATLSGQEDLCQAWGTPTGVCYIGHLQMPACGNDEKCEKITLYYDGALIPVEDGVYSFKDDADIGELNFLFIDPELITYANEGNTIEALVVPENAKYDLYVLKRIECLGAQRTFNWRIQKAQLATRKAKGNGAVLVIPLHTLIIPLERQFFKVDEHGAIVFTRQPFTSKNSTVHLPTPVTSATDTQVFSQALARAQLAVVNLKTFHAPQPTKQVVVGGHNVSMYY